jgi:hypothetical protein
MTPNEVRMQAEIDRLRAALRSIADECEGILRVRFNEVWEVNLRVQQIGIRAGEMIDTPDRSDW